MLILRFDLPHHIWIEGEALGLHSLTRIGPVEVEVRLPKLVAATKELDTPSTTAPDLPAPVVGRGEDHEWSRNYAAFLPTQAVGLLAVAIVVDDGAIDQCPRPSWGGQGMDKESLAFEFLAERIDWWADDFRTWVEVETGQDLNHAHPNYDYQGIGENLAKWEEGEFRKSQRFRLTTPRITPANRSQLLGIFAKLRMNETAPLEDTLLRDARAASVRGDRRRAILDAAASTEVILTRVFNESLSALTDELAGAVIGENRTLGRLISVLGKAKIDMGAAQSEINEKLVKLRNAAAHRGESPSSWDTVEAINVANKVIERHGVLH